MIAQTKERCAGYVRVSSPGQLDGFGFARQGDSLDIFERGTNYSLVLVGFESYTGTEARRPSLDALIAFCKREDVQTIIIEDQGRLGRDLIVQLQLIKEIYQEGLHVVEASSNRCLTKAYFEGSPTERLIVELLASVGAWERNTIVDKLSKARKAKKKKTGRCEGRVPFGGYPNEKDCYEKIVEMYEAGLSRQDMADCLNEAGFTTRNGHRWTEKSLWKIVRRLQKQVQEV